MLTGIKSAGRVSFRQTRPECGALPFIFRWLVDHASLAWLTASHWTRGQFGRKLFAVKTDVAEIADGIYRLSTFIPDIAPPAGFTFNQFLITAAEPLLFHCPADVSARFSSAFVDNSDRATALDQLWSCGIR